MFAAQSSAIVTRLWAMLLLATIALQSALPLSAPLQLSQGSAFSAATYETAVAPQRRNDGNELAVASQPLDPWLASAPPREVPLLTRRTVAALHSPAIASPSDRSGFWLPGARAPPLA